MGSHGPTSHRQHFSLAHEAGGTRRVTLGVPVPCPLVPRRPLTAFRRVLSYLLGQTHLRAVLLAIALLAVGVASCHNIAMFSVRGMDGVVFARFTWGSIPAIGFAILACGLVILSFLLLPTGLGHHLSTIVITGTLAAYHYASMHWAVVYTYSTSAAPTPTGFVLTTNAVLVFVALQSVVTLGHLGQFFSHMTIAHYLLSQQQLQTVENLASNIAAMDLEQCREIQDQSKHQLSALENSLFQIVDNFELYRPFLPQHLFSNQVWPGVADVPSPRVGLGY